MPDPEGAQVPEPAAGAEPSPMPVPPIEAQIATLEAERSKVSTGTSFNLRRGLTDGIPAGTFFILGGVLLLVLGFLRNGLLLGYLGGALLLWVIGFLLYALSCWSRWRREEHKRLSLLAVLDQQIARKQDELRQEGKNPPD